MSFIAIGDKKLLSFLAQMSLLLRQTLESAAKVSKSSNFIAQLHCNKW